MKASLTLNFTLILLCICVLTSCNSAAQEESGTKNNSKMEPYLIRTCSDFTMTGDGSNPEWDKASWEFLTKLDNGGRNYESKFKILASGTGIYVLFHGEDDKITTKDYEDMDKIWNGDVFEVFFHPDPQRSQYYEYEVNALEKQLVLSISGSQGVSWIPFNEYDKNSYGINNKVQVFGGTQEIDSQITSWKAEVFLSFKSMALMQNVPPKSGTIWNANFYRLDYDSGNMIKWSWTPTIEKSFHELDKFRAVKFE